MGSPSSKEKKKQWYYDNHEKALAGKRAAYRKNPEHFKARNRAYYLANREKLKAQSREWSLLNPGFSSVRDRRKHAADPRPRLLRSAAYRAKKKGLEFNLKLEDIVLPGVCPVLRLRFTVEGGRQPTSYSLDRIDNSLGYVRGNVAVISFRANAIKGDATPEELMAVAKYAVDNRW
jgi:hypothetical protein